LNWNPARTRSARLRTTTRSSSDAWKDLPEDDDVRVGQFMQLGPATVRPRGELRDLVERMRAARVKAILVTSGKGRLLGVVNGDEGERLVKEREGRSRTAESVT